MNYENKRKLYDITNEAINVLQRRLWGAWSAVVATCATIRRYKMVELQLYMHSFSAIILLECQLM